METVGIFTKGTLIIYGFLYEVFQGVFATNFIDKQKILLMNIWMYNSTYFLDSSL